MYRSIIFGLNALAVGLFSTSAMAQCTSYPYTLTNGTTADATQVMANFNCAALTSGSTITNLTLTGTTNLPGSGTITSSGSIGIGTASPQGELHVVGSSFNSQSSSNAPFGDGDSVIQGTDSGKTAGKGASLTFAYPADTDGGNVWEQARIVGGADNSANLDASGRMTLQTRYFNGGSWDWTNGIVLTSSGNVGIGTTSPGTKLVVSGDADIVSGWNNSQMFINGYTNSAYTLALGYDTTNNLGVIQALESGVAYENLSLNPNGGNVGIGTTTPSYLLTVNGTAYATGAAGALSDIRHKKNVAALADGAIAVVMKLRPVTFEWKTPTDDGMKGKQIGFIAQDVEKVLPSVVLTQKNAEKTKGLKYSEFIPILTKAVQEQQVQVAAQQAQVAALKAVNDNQSSQIRTLRLQVTSQRQLLNAVKSSNSEAIARLMSRLSALERRNTTKVAAK